MTEVRDRLSDVPALVALLPRMHDEQRYPVRQESVAAAGLVPTEELAAWVAVDGDVLGHVALHPVHGESTVLWSQAPGRLIVSSRLFTDGSQRGTGAQLLDHAVSAAQRHGCPPCWRCGARARRSVGTCGVAGPR